MVKSSARLCPRVDSPCSTPPTFAKGQKSAFCSSCQKDVHNLSALTAGAQQKLFASGAPLCVRYVRLLPVVVMLVAMEGAQAQETPSTDPQQSEGTEELREVVVGGGGPYLESMFLQSDLDVPLDDVLAGSVDDLEGVTK